LNIPISSDYFNSYSSGISGSGYYGKAQS